MDRETIDSLLEMHLHGELPASLRKKAEAVLATEEGRRRYEEIRESDRRILEELPPEQVAEAIRRKLSVPDVGRAAVPASRIGMGWLGAGGAAVACAILALVVFERAPAPESVVERPVALAPKVTTDSVRESSVVASVEKAVATVAGGAAAPRRKAADVLALAPVEDDGIRTKGDETRRLRVFRKDAARGGAASLRDGDSVAAGNVLQVGVAGGAAVWAAVVSVDAFGQATLHLPETGDSAVRIRDEISAPHSFELDDSRGFERFLLVASSERFSLDEVLSVARRAGRSDPVRKGWVFESVRLVKP